MGNHSKCRSKLEQQTVRDIVVLSVAAIAEWREDS